LYALVNHLGQVHTEWKETVIEPNDWINQNREKLKCFWAYQQIHHWNRPNVMLTGSQGDEYFLRGPCVISMIMAWHDIDFVKLLEQNPDAYHHWHFSKPKHRELFVSGFQNRIALKDQYPTWKSLCDQIINILANDHQHWHLGETLTWTPQKDLDIARWALCLPIQELIQNSLHGSLIRHCIQRLMPSALDSVSRHKNRPG
jgi:asparagine synthetase B (glutamine-hydrolysing)